MRAQAPDRHYAIRSELEPTHSDLIHRQSGPTFLHDHEGRASAYPLHAQENYIFSLKWAANGLIAHKPSRLAYPTKAVDWHGVFGKYGWGGRPPQQNNSLVSIERLLE